MTDNDSTRLRDLLSGPGSGEALRAFLVENSRLPGPRANLGLAKQLADQFGAAGTDDETWDLLRPWLTISAAEAPAGDPREFLPFCALQALGALYDRAEPARRAEIEAAIGLAASDPRWRVREGAAIALQRIGLRDFSALRTIVDRWLPSATLLEQRAILAALAEPPLLRAPGAPAYALAVADQLLQTVRGRDATQRKREPFRVLRQALEYAISVIVVASPDEGFASLRAWAMVDDPDIQRILRVNLGKARLRRVETSRDGESASRES